MRAPVRGVVSTLSASFDAEDRQLTFGEDAYAFTPDGYLASKTTSAGRARATLPRCPAPTRTRTTGRGAFRP